LTLTRPAAPPAQALPAQAGPEREAAPSENARPAYPAPERREVPRDRRAHEASARLIVDRPGIMEFEAFVDSLDFVRSTEHARLKLAGGEIFDNLIRHAAPLADDSALVRVVRRRSGRDLYLCFYFKSPTFAPYVSHCVDHEPVFDRRLRRWHGMGLRMTRNLSASLTFRAGTLCDRIFIRF